MFKKSIFVRVFVLSVALVLFLGTAAPAKAFYLELPKAFKQALESLRLLKTYAQEAPPPATYTPPPDSGTYVPPPTDNYTLPPPTTPPPGDTYQPPPTTPPPPTSSCQAHADNCCSGVTGDPDCGQGPTTTPPPSGGLNCTGGMFPCYSANKCMNTWETCSDTGSATPTTPPPTTQQQPTTACTGGQYWCAASNKCIGSTESCSSYATPYQPQTQTGACPSGQTKCYGSGSPDGWCQSDKCPSATPTTQPNEFPCKDNMGNPAKACDQYGSCSCYYKTCSSGRYDNNGKCVVDYQPAPCSGPNCPVDKQYQPQMPQYPQQPEMKPMPPVDFQNIRQGAWEMERNLKKFESDMFSFEKKGMAIPSGLKEKLTRMKTEMTDLKSVRTSEQLQDKGINTEEINATLQELENARRENEQKVRCTEDVRRGSRDMEREVKDFERRLKRLTAKKIAIPSEILDTLKKIKDNLAKMKTVKLCDDIHDIMGEMPDLMQSLNQSREQLEMLARWPQMSQNMNRELKRMTSELKRAKNIVSRLSKRGIDISDVYNAFETAVNNLKVAKAEAEEKVAAGDLEGATESLQSDFYGQMEDVWQNQRVITMMQGLGQFQSEFKRTVAELQRKANALKRKKVVVSELTELLNQLKEKGAEITAMFKEKPIDPDGIVAAIDEMHGIRAEFDDALAALTGQTTAMPWQTGTAQFKAVQMSATVQQWMPSTAPATTATGPAVFGPSPGEMAGESNPSPAP